MATPTSSPPYQPGLPWRASSSATIAFVGTLCKTFLFGASRTETHGLDRFVALLEERRNVEGRQRGLITVSNHVSVLDDPLIWGVLPFRYYFEPNSMRWSLGSHDLCFTNKMLSVFFNYGQTLPTHRTKHSPHGGLFQPTITQAIRLLSSPLDKNTITANIESLNTISKTNTSLTSPDLSDPFSNPHLTYTTNGVDSFPAPSAYLSRRHAWVHIFPEGSVHQHPAKTMRYFRWGVARLILEPDECPDVVPMWIEGPQEIMHESREFPRFIPRVGKKVAIWFGENVAGKKPSRFLELRKRWRDLVEKEGKKYGVSKRNEDRLGVLNDELKYGQEAVELRMECAMEVRKEVLRVRRSRGLPDEDPKASLVETWRHEGALREGRMKDESWVKDM